MLSGVTIIFNPNSDIIENIQSYISHLEQLYLIDNSKNKNQLLLEKINQTFPKCKLIANPENYGIAHALNQAVDLATNDGYDWLLTMDQDSSFYDSNYFKVFKEYTTKENVALFTPQIVFNLDEIESGKNISFKQLDEPFMTSGCIINVKLCNQLGRFEEKLFIDEVDTDYYYKVLLSKSEMLQIDRTYLIHALGTERSIHLPFNKTIRIFEHQPFRHYYITRNFLYLVKKYGFKLPHLILFRFRKVFLIKLAHGVLFHKNRLAVIKYTLLGFFDFVRGKYGKL